MHGTEKVAVEDVRGIGKAIGVKFNGSNAICLMCCRGRGEVVGS